MPGAKENSELTDEERLKLEKEKPAPGGIGLERFMGGKEEPGEGEQKEEKKEEEALPAGLGLDMILQFIASVASQGLPPELKKKFVKEYIEFNEMPLTAIGWDKSIGWLLQYLEIMPDWQRFLVGCGFLVGSGIYMRVEFSKIIKDQLKQGEKGKGKPGEEPAK